MGGQIFKIAASRVVNLSEEEINLMKENAIPRNTKHATKFGMTLFKDKAKFRRRTSHEPNRMLMRENKGFFSFAFDSAHVKYGV